MAVAADSSSILWSTDKAGVFYSKDGGATWTQSAVYDGTMLPTGAKIASDRVNKNVFYAFAQRQNVHQLGQRRAFQY